MRQRRWLPIFGLLLLSGCGGEGVPPVVDEPRFIASDAGTSCAHPSEGCACSPEQPPIDCYLDPVIDEGQVTCSRGTRYCRGGAWTACESIESYQLRSGPGIAALITGPTACNVCDPACAVSRDEPNDADLGANSRDVIYDPAAGGIIIDPVDFPPPPVLPDGDGDGVPDIADQCVGAGAFLAADGSCYGDSFIYEQLPYGYPPVTASIAHTLIIQSADVYFLVDTSGSMSGELGNLRTSLTTGTFRGCTGGVIGAVRCNIPDSYFGVGSHEDYPVAPYGTAGDAVYRHALDLSADTAAAQAALDGLVLRGQADLPESQSQALWAIASGGGLGPYLAARTGCAAGTSGYPCFRDGVLPIVVMLTDSAFHNGPSGNNYAFTTSGLLPAATPATGNDTRATAIRVGDAATSWTGWSGNTCGFTDNYDAPCVGDTNGDVVFEFTVSTTSTIVITTEGSTYDSTITLYNDAGTAIACDDDAGPGLTSLIQRTLAPGTYFVVVMGWSTACGNYRLSIGSVTGFPVTWADAVSALSGAGVRVITVSSGDAAAVADANALADASGSYSPTGARNVYQVAADGTGVSDAVVDAILGIAGYTRMDVTAQPVDNTATAIDETGFVDAITAVSFGPGSCAGISGGTTFQQCVPGTNVTFNVSLQNDIVMPTAAPQVFDFWIDIMGDGTVLLERVPVRIVVPAMFTTYLASAAYWREYDSTIYCAASERPDWWELVWNVPSIPAGTSVRWELRTADTQAGLSSATPVTFVVPGTTSPQDVGARLVAAGESNFLRYLRVTAVLLSNADLSATPVLHSFEQKYICTPSE